MIYRTVGATVFDGAGGFVAPRAAVDTEAAESGLEVEGPGDEPGLLEGGGMVTHTCPGFWASKRNFWCVDKVLIIAHGGHFGSTT